MSVSSCSEDGRLFQVLGPAHENERSANLRRMRGRSYRWLLVDRRRAREVTSADAVTHSRRWDGARPMWTRWIGAHNLNTIRCLMGNQCRSFRVAVTWSYEPGRATSRAAAFWTRCNGVMVDLGRLILHCSSPIYWTQVRPRVWLRHQVQELFVKLVSDAECDKSRFEWLCWCGSASTVRCPR